MIVIAFHLEAVKSAQAPKSPQAHVPFESNSVVTWACIVLLWMCRCCWRLDQQLHPRRLSSFYKFYKQWCYFSGQISSWFLSSSWYLVLNWRQWKPKSPRNHHALTRQGSCHWLAIVLSPWTAFVLNLLCKGLAIPPKVENDKSWWQRCGGQENISWLIYTAQCQDAGGHSPKAP